MIETIEKLFFWTGFAMWGWWLGGLVMHMLYIRDESQRATAEKRSGSHWSVGLPPHMTASGRDVYVGKEPVVLKDKDKQETTI